MPGANCSIRNNQKKDPTWAFTYSTRLAWYPFNHKLALVSEVYGSLKNSRTYPEYKTGIRWKSNENAVFAITYSEKFDGSRGAGFEFGVMLFTPPFCGLVKQH